MRIFNRQLDPDFKKSDMKMAPSYIKAHGIPTGLNLHGEFKWRGLGRGEINKWPIKIEQKCHRNSFVLK